MIRKLFSVFLTLFLFRWKILPLRSAQGQDDRIIFLFLIISFIQNSSTWGLAPETRIERDFDVRPYFKLSEVRAKEIARLMRPAPYVVFDFEATSLDPYQAKPIEMAALKFEGSRLVGKFYSLVNPGEKLLPIVTQVTGITDEMLQGQPSADEVMRRFAAFIEGCDLVGHNIQKFDIPILETHLDRLKLLYPKKPYIFDTKGLAQKLVSRERLDQFTLGNISRAAGSPIAANHSALRDVVANAYAFWYLKEIEERGRRAFDSHYKEKQQKLRAAIQTIVDFLESDTPKFNGAPSCDLVVLFGHYGMKGAEKAARVYRERRAKKIVLFAEGHHNNGESISPLAESYRRVLVANGVREEDLLFVTQRPQMDERLEAVADAIRHFGFEHGTIRFMGDSFSQKRLSLTLKKMIAQGKFPTGTRNLLIPYFRFQVGVLKDKNAEFKAAQNAVLAITTLDFGAKQGWHQVVDLPPSVVEAYEILRQALFTAPEKNSKAVENSV